MLFRSRTKRGSRTSRTRSRRPPRQCPLPPPTPEGFFAKVKKGQPLELDYLDGFWEVVVKKVLANGDLRVEAPAYGAAHTVPRDRLRPAWVWRPGRWTMR